MTEQTKREPQSSAEYHQERGVAWDIVDEALIAFDQFMRDDDYDYQRALYSIMERMKARRELYAHGEKGDKEPSR